MEGKLSEGVLPGVLRDIYVKHFSGTLRFTREDEVVELLFLDGQIVRGNTNVEKEQLGHSLLKQGLISQTDFEHATTIVLQEKSRLGKALIDLGILDRDRLEAAVAVHLREVLRNVFSWGEGLYAFQEQTERPSPADCDLTLRVPTGEMILEAVKRVTDPDVIRYALGDLDRVIGMSTDPLLRFQNIGLTPVDGYVISRIDGETSIRELLQLIPMVPEETLKSLFGLLSVGMLEFLPVPKKAPPPPPKPLVVPPPPIPPPTVVAAPLPPPPAVEDAVVAHRKEIRAVFQSLKTKNHFEILGIPRASSEAQVKDAYFRLAKRYHPDTQRNPALAELKQEMDAIFIRLGEAYEVLRNPSSRSAYESDLVARTPRIPQAGSAGTEAAPPPPPVGPNAEELSRKAEKLMVQEKFWDAIQILEQAVPAGEGRVKGKARVLLARCYLKNPKWVHRAEEVLQLAIRDDPKYAEPYFVLGTIYKGGGLKSRALSMFKKTLEMKPDHEQAAQEVESLERAEPPDPPPPPEGFLKKLFGKP